MQTLAVCSRVLVRALYQAGGAAACCSASEAALTTSAGSAAGASCNATVAASSAAACSAAAASSAASTVAATSTTSSCSGITAGGSQHQVTVSVTTRSPNSRTMKPQNLQFIATSSGCGKTRSGGGQQVLRKWTFGDDACFIASHPRADFLGVADGVGGWRQYGVDPSRLAGQLMRRCARLVVTDCSPPPPPAPPPTRGCCGPSKPASTSPLTATAAALGAGACSAAERVGPHHHSVPPLRATGRPWSTTATSASTSSSPSAATAPAHSWSWQPSSSAAPSAVLTPGRPDLLLRAAHAQLQAERAPPPGSCTVCLVGLYRGAGVATSTTGLEAQLEPPPPDPPSSSSPSLPASAPSSAAAATHAAAAAGRIYWCNLGDSGLLLVRDGRLVARSAVQQHYFNAPYQLAAVTQPLPPPPAAAAAEADSLLTGGGGGGGMLADGPAAAALASCPVLPGDLLLVATDGLWDNLDEAALLALVGPLSRRCSRRAAAAAQEGEEEQAEGEEKTEEGESAAHTTVKAQLQQLAARLVAEARRLAHCPRHVSPFAAEARRHLGLPLTGGKPDDITVIVALISPAAAATAAAPAAE